MNVFEKLRLASTERETYFNPEGTPIPISFRLMELGGEAGEVLNAGKKLARHEMSMVGGCTDITNMKEELGDVIICCELIAKHYNIDLWEAVVEKFNKTSEKHNFPVKMEI
jgi:NTP pyrophosphatase (non-canonical NTP hydrolase)